MQGQVSQTCPSALRIWRYVAGGRWWICRCSYVQKRTSVRYKCKDGGTTLGSTISYLHLKNLGYTGSDVAEYGSQIFFGRVGGGVTNSVGLVFRGGGSTNGTDAFDTSGPNLVIDQTLRRFGLNGITAPLGTYHLVTESTSATSASDILLQDSGGSTIAIRTAISGSTGEYEGLEGASALPRLDQWFPR